MFLHIPYRCKIEQPDTRHIMELKILKRKCACVSSSAKIIWKPLSLKMSTTLRVKSSAVLSAEIIREQRDAEAEKNSVYCFQFALYF